MFRNLNLSTIEATSGFTTTHKRVQFYKEITKKELIIRTVQHYIQKSILAQTDLSFAD